MELEKPRKARQRSTKTEQYAVVQAPRPKHVEAKHLHRWALGRQILIAMPAQTTAAWLPRFRQLGEWYNTGVVASATGGRIPPPATWLAMYQSPEKVKKRLLKTFWAEGTEGANRHEVNAYFMKALMRVKASGGDQAAARQMLGRVSNDQKILMRASYEQAFSYQYNQNLIAVEESLAETWAPSSAELESIFSRPEALFFMCVLFPCALAYGESAWDMFQRARQGDYGAIDQLIRVDKQVLHDEQIRTRALKLGLGGEAVGLDMVADALKGRPKFPDTQMQINYMACAVIARVAEKFEIEITAREFRDLLDAAAKDRTGDPLATEQEFADDLDSAKKSIGRYKPFWDKILGRDKDSDLSCPRDFGLFPLVSDAHAEAERPTWLIGPEGMGKPYSRKWWWAVAKAAYRRWFKPFRKLAAALFGRSSKQ